MRSTMPFRICNQMGPQEKAWPRHALCGRFLRNWLGGHLAPFGGVIASENEESHLQPFCRPLLKESTDDKATGANIAHVGSKYMSNALTIKKLKNKRLPYAKGMAKVQGLGILRCETAWFCPCTRPACYHHQVLGRTLGPNSFLRPPHPHPL